MYIYILTETYGEWGDIRTFNIAAYFSKEKAEDEMKSLRRFTPVGIYDVPDNIQRCCAYELHKRGISINWRDVPYVDFPSFAIEEVEVVDTLSGGEE